MADFSPAYIQMMAQVTKTLGTKWDLYAGAENITNYTQKILLFLPMTHSVLTLMRAWYGGLLMKESFILASGLKLNKYKCSAFIIYRYERIKTKDYKSIIIIALLLVIIMLLVFKIINPQQKILIRLKTHRQLKTTGSPKTIRATKK